MSPLLRAPQLQVKCCKNHHRHWAIISFISSFIHQSLDIIHLFSKSTLSPVLCWGLLNVRAHSAREEAVKKVSDYIHCDETSDTTAIIKVNSGDQASGWGNAHRISGKLEESDASNGQKQREVTQQDHSQNPTMRKICWGHHCWSCFHSYSGKQAVLAAAKWKRINPQVVWREVTLILETGVYDEPNRPQQGGKQQPAFQLWGWMQSFQDSSWGNPPKTRMGFGCQAAKHLLSASHMPDAVLNNLHAISHLILTTVL